MLKEIFSSILYLCTTIIMLAVILIIILYICNYICETFYNDYDYASFNEKVVFIEAYDNHQIKKTIKNRIIYSKLKNDTAFQMRKLFEENRKNEYN